MPESFVINEVFNLRNLENNDFLNLKNIRKRRESSFDSSDEEGFMSKPDKGDSHVSANLDTCPDIRVDLISFIAFTPISTEK